VIILTKICPECGASNINIAKSCRVCGNKFKGPVKVISKPSWWSKQSKRKKRFYEVSFCCIGLLIIIFIAGVISNEANQNPLDDKEYGHILKDLGPLRNSTDNISTIQASYISSGKYNYSLPDNIPVIHGKAVLLNLDKEAGFTGFSQETYPNGITNNITLFILESGDIGPYGQYESGGTAQYVEATVSVFYWPEKKFAGRYNIWDPPLGIRELKTFSGITTQKGQDNKYNFAQDLVIDWINSLPQNN
jgi:hypothetical protein